MKNKLLSAILSVCMLFSLCACGGTEETNSEQRHERETAYCDGMEVHFIDVGQGDSALVLCGKESMLIDGGKPYASDIIYTYLKNLGVEELDYVVCSHADEDHIGGLAAPLSTMRVHNVLMPETGSDANVYQTLMKKISEQKITPKHPKAGSKMKFADGTAEFFGPVSENGDKNNSSIVMKIIYGDTSFLFTGDAEREEEQEILDKGYDLSATVLKVGHHGSKNSTTYPFLREIMPKYAVISVGKENSYGHPTEETLSRLRDADVKVYRTDMQGDIIMKSDGKHVSVSTKRNENAEVNPTVKPQITPSPVSAETSDIKNTTDSAVTYIANRNSKKFHRPSCGNAKKMNESNKVSLNCSRDEAIAAGYQPCKKCNP